MKIRRYGDNNTIHHSTDLNIETDSRGNVVAVWFRCQAVPFTQSEAGKDRVREMKEMYRHPKPKILALILEDQ